MEPVLYSHQQDAVKKMKNGCILCGGVGTGKSMTGLAYYYYRVCKSKPTLPLYIITTAQKRDNKEWVIECGRWGIPDEFGTPLTIDSWNNIEKYIDIDHAFFIFDEHKAIGNGKWSKCFLKIVKKNNWIILSATPGDNWLDYIPVFVANNFYKNRTEFIREHVVVNPYVSYFSVKNYINIEKLIALRNSVLVEMPFERFTIKKDIEIMCDYDKKLYNLVWKERWNPYEDRPIQNASELCYTLRKVCNSHKDRAKKVLELAEQRLKVIIFYNYDYELEILKKLFNKSEFIVTEWNGHQHDELSTTEKWVHLVQYAAGAEGWNCVTSDTIIFYSLSYSYKQTEQAAGRIDRLNTPFDTLYYYKLFTDSDIDKAIQLALKIKKEFNAKKFADNTLYFT